MSEQKQRKRSGPMKRQEMYRHILKGLLTDGYFDEWRETNEICERVNQQIPTRWTQLQNSRLFMYMRELPMDEKHYWKNAIKQMVREWKIS